MSKIIRTCGRAKAITEQVMTGLGFDSKKLTAGLNAFFHMSPPTIDRISYSDAIHYFVTHPIASSRTSNGAILMRPEGQGHIVIQAFVDDDWNVLQDSDGRPLGRKLKVQKVDDDLTTAFAGKEVLVVPGISRILTTDASCDFLKFDDVVDYFASTLPQHAGEIAGALIIRKRARDDYRFQQIFLDSDDRLICAPGGKPYGRQISATQIDKRLQEVIGATKDVILFNGLRPGDTKSTKSPNRESKEQDIPNQQPNTKQDPHTLPPTPQSKPTRFGIPLARRLLTYREVVEYFVTQRPAHRDACKGALLIRREGGKYAIEQTFLNEQGEPVVDRKGNPFGRRILVADLDAELRDVVGTNQVVVFE